MYPSELKRKVTRMRSRGYSYSRIQEVTGIPRSTLSTWLSNMKVELSRSTLLRAEKNKRENIARKKLQKLLEIEQTRKLARDQLGSISRRDLWVAGVGLYWGEGKKYKETVAITNSNPKLIKFFVNWLTTLCSVPLEDLRAEIHIYPDSDIKLALEYWGTITGIPEHNFYKTQVDRRPNKKLSKVGTLPHGTLHLYMNSRSVSIRKLHRRIMTWVDIISNESLFAEVV